MGLRERVPENRTKAIILAAGYATRLYPLTLGIPKPLLKITPDKAVIDFIVDSLVGSVEEIFVVTNRKFYADFQAWRRGRGPAERISVINDGTRCNEDRLGAIGDIYDVIARENVASDVVVVGGDNLFEKSFDPFLSFARRSSPRASLGLFDIKDRASASRFGVVSVDRRGRLTRFQEKPRDPKSTLVATCLYYFPAQTLPLLKTYALDETTSNDASGNYIRWLMERQEVYGFTLTKGHWFDIGHLDSYKEVVARYNGSVK
ncbi:MAG: nucleotidyltransferase family protein [Candidatus Omnitrophota bacterium]